jgi:hypothetical protein
VYRVKEGSLGVVRLVVGVDVEGGRRVVEINFGVEPQDKAVEDILEPC